MWSTAARLISHYRPIQARDLRGNRRNWKRQTAKAHESKPFGARTVLAIKHFLTFTKVVQVCVPSPHPTTLPLAKYRITSQRGLCLLSLAHGPQLAPYYTTLRTLVESADTIRSDPPSANFQAPSKSFNVNVNKPSPGQFSARYVAVALFLV